MKPVSNKQVSIEDRFWAERIKTNREAGLPHQYKMLKDTGRLDALKLEWKPGDPNEPHIFWESDTAKWLEAASYSLGVFPNPELENMVDEVIALLAHAQQPDGYLNAHYTVVEPGKRWSNLRDCHELYCAGHLIEAGVAHYEATGKWTLLDIVCKYADYIDTVFGTEEGKIHGYCGHEEIELALVKLYKTTQEKRYLNLAQYFVEERGKQPHYFDTEREGVEKDWFKDWFASMGVTYNHSYNQSHLPVREQTEAVGHCVRAMYLYSGIADIARENNDPTLLETCKTLWNSMATRRMYFTGGIGSDRRIEGFSSDYDLGNMSGYAETCAAIGIVFFASRMLQLDMNSKYSDIMEKALYNGVISGISLDGKRFFYENPLESLGSHHRQEWFGCACCPPNIARLLASLGTYAFSADEDKVAMHLYIQGLLSVKIKGNDVDFQINTNYPWDGKVNIEVKTENPVDFDLYLRIPGWCDNPEASIECNSIDIASNTQNGYLKISRTWKSGDILVLDFPMIPKFNYSHPAIRENAGCTAITRGPLVYCFEEVDLNKKPHYVCINTSVEPNDSYDDNLLGGIVKIIVQADVLDEDGWDSKLYNTQPPTATSEEVQAVPYYAWDNREPGAMRVWMRAKI